MDLSSRSRYTKDFQIEMVTRGFQAMKNAYDSETNPSGIVNLGTAENFLCEDIWLQKMNEPEMTKFNSTMQYYFEYKGSASFRTAVAQFLSERFRSHEPINPDDLMMTSGVAAALDLLAYAIADEGDCFLCSAPLYSVIVADIGYRSRVKLLPMQLPGRDSGPGKMFKLTVDILERNWNEAKQKGNKVRGLILVNPDNPTGTVMEKQVLEEIIQFCHKHELHVICDEIYGLSVWESESRFCSALSLPHIPDPNKLHVVWGFSKDFALSGFRCGVIHTRNPDFYPSIHFMLFWGSVTPLVQHRLERVVSDKEWLDNVYFPTNLSRLKDSFDYVKKALVKLDVRVMDDTRAAFFVWADFSKHLKHDSQEEEDALWEEFLNNGVLILPGSVFLYKEVGWFRVLFAHKRLILDEALCRIEKSLQNYACVNARIGASNS